MHEQINHGGESRKSEHAGEAKREFALSVIRSARARVQMLASEIDEIGVSLRLNMIDAEFAVGWMDYIGALQFANVEPWITKVGMEAS